MAKEAKVFPIQIFSGIPVIILAVIDNLTTGEILIAADVDTITYDIFDPDSPDPSIPFKTGTVTVATALHPLKKDAKWTEDSTGYNFDHQLPYDSFPTIGKTYTLRYLFTLSGDTQASSVLVFSVYVLSTRG